VGTPFANYFEAFIHPLAKLLEPLGEVAEAFDWTEFLIMGGSSVGIGLIGITLAVMMYRTKAIDPAAIADKSSPCTSSRKTSGTSTRFTMWSSSRAVVSLPSRCLKLMSALSMASLT
jgi:hypothetical protein